MTLIELYAKNNYHLKTDWELSDDIDYAKLENILFNSEKENFNHSIILYHETMRQGAITEFPRLKQILTDMEKVIIPNVILSKKAIIYKSPKDENLYFLDDNFAYVLFSYDQKNKQIKVFDIITSIIFYIGDIDNDL